MQATLGAAQADTCARAGNDHAQCRVARCVMRCKTPLVERSHLPARCVQVWEGKQVISYGRTLIGATNPLASPPGSIRGDYGIDVVRAAPTPARLAWVTPCRLQQQETERLGRTRKALACFRCFLVGGTSWRRRGVRGGLMTLRR